MSKKFLNVKVGVEFYNALITRPSFQNNQNAVSPCFYLVKRITELNARNHGDPVEFYSGTIADIFRPYTNGRYAEFVSDLESLGILLIDHHYKPSDNKSGECQKYFVTDYGCQLIHSSNMEYLKKLKTDPQVRRNNQKSISKRKVMKKSYEHPVLDYIYDGLKNMSYDYDSAEHAIEKSVWSNAQKANVSGTLNRFGQKKFDDLEIGDKDGRVHHEEVRLKSDGRILLNYKGLPYRAVLDIRCCHPTFLSSLFHSPPYTLHYVTDKGDISSELAREHEKWIALFCNPDVDPKQVIKKSCGFPDVETAKAAMNQSLNGSTLYPEFLTWMKTEFPLIYKLWRKSNVKDTTNAIGRIFERELMLHEELYRRAEALGGIKIMPEHDGLGVFAREDDSELSSKLESIKNYLQSYSIKKFGVPIVIKSKMAVNWANADLLMEMQHKRKELDKDYAKLKPRVTRLQRKYFATKKDRTTGKLYGAALDKEHDLLQRNKDVLDYWVEREKRNLS